MRILLDTHILLWWLADDQRLPGPIRAAVADGRNSVYVSAISVAEIAITGSLGKLQSPGDLAAAIVGSGLSHLPFTAEHADHLSALPWHHRDPFDRMLIAQAVVESMTFASVDPVCGSYDVQLLS
jgi:PIN domain nuclease of toxin-antitoxin system